MKHEDVKFFKGVLTFNITLKDHGNHGMQLHLSTLLDYSASG